MAQILPGSNSGKDKQAHDALAAAGDSVGAVAILAAVLHPPLLPGGPYRPSIHLLADDKVADRIECDDPVMAKAVLDLMDRWMAKNGWKLRDSGDN